MPVNFLHLFYVFLLIFIVFPGYVFPSEKVTLTEAIKIAFEENHEIKAFRNSLLAQKEGVGIARSFLLPRLSFEERAARTNNPPQVFMMKLNQQRFGLTDFELNNLNYPPATTDYQTMFSFEQPVFAMKSFLGFSMAKLEHAAKSDEYLRKKEEIALAVTQAYFRVRTAREFLTVAETGLQDTKEHVRIAEVRYKNGVGIYADLLRSQTALTEAEQRQVRARKDFAVSQRWLGLLLGKSEDAGIVDEKIDVAVFGVDHYQGLASSRRDVKAMEKRHQNTQKNVKRAESSYLPYVGVGGSYQFNDPKRVFGTEGESWYVNAFLRWDLFDGAGREYERSKAQYQMAEAQEYLSGFKKQVSFKVQEAYLAVEETKKNLELSEKALKTAEEGKRLVKSRYENSLAPIVDLLDTQLYLDRARADYVARENEYQLAIIKLCYESGTILNELKIE
jgi:outer membrane protein TolC